MFAIVKSKNYTVSSVKTTRTWSFACKNGSGSGTGYNTKKEACQAAKAACGSKGMVTITSPLYDAEYLGGALNHFAVKNLDEVIINYTTQDIEKDLFDFFFGISGWDDADYDEYNRILTIFKIWGIYLKGGNNKTEMLSLYNLTEPEFQKLIIKDYIDVQIQIDYNLNYTWIFPA